MTNHNHTQLVLESMKQAWRAYHKVGGEFWKAKHTVDEAWLKRLPLRNVDTHRAFGVQVTCLITSSEKDIHPQSTYSCCC